MQDTSLNISSAVEEALAGSSDHSVSAAASRVFFEDSIGKPVDFGTPLEQRRQLFILFMIYTYAESQGFSHERFMQLQQRLCDLGILALPQALVQILALIPHLGMYKRSRRAWLAPQPPDLTKWAGCGNGASVVLPRHPSARGSSHACFRERFLFQTRISCVC